MSPSSFGRRYESPISGKVHPELRRHARVTLAGVAFVCVDVLSAIVIRVERGERARFPALCRLEGCSIGKETIVLFGIAQGRIAGALCGGGRSERVATAGAMRAACPAQISGREAQAQICECGAVPHCVWQILPTKEDG